MGGSESRFDAEEEPWLDATVSNDKSIVELEDILLRSQPGSWWIGFGKEIGSRFGDSRGDMLSVSWSNMLGTNRVSSMLLPTVSPPPPNLAVISRCFLFNK